MEKLGEGQFGCVVKGGEYLEGDTIVVCKDCITKIASLRNLIQELSLFPLLSSTDPDELYHCAVRGYHIVTSKELEACKIPINNQSKTDMSIVYTYGGPTLISKIGKTTKAADMKFILYDMLHVLYALKWLKSINVVHSDIKSDNICISETGAKLIDFGLAKRLSSPTEILQYYERVWGPYAPFEISGFIRLYSRDRYDMYLLEIKSIYGEAMFNKLKLDDESEYASFQQILRDPIETCKLFWDKFDLFRVGQMILLNILMYKELLLREIHPELYDNMLYIIKNMIRINPFRRWNIERTIKEYTSVLEKYVEINI